ncbi:MAG TPA: efflux RND transporter periplasmic adaptor subunit [Usitatibacter sp.]|nr:efflux RND transporter periplasmic adaptor subunit [Usitatibacter sp.]
MTQTGRSQALRRAKILALVVVLALAIGAARTLVSRSSNARALEAGTAEQAKIYVKVASPTVGGAATTLTLPGTLQGAVQAPIAARASGYVKRWTRDIGSRVDKGELLAEIESPEIDQQLSQAMAAREQLAASLALAKSTLERWEELRKTGMVPQQQLDERRSATVQAQANLAAADANIERLRELQAFKRIVAPFPGVITRRNVNVGDLIDAGGARALFVLTQTDPLRVYVEVPQAYAHLVRVGQPVTVTQAELRGKTFKGEVARTAAAIDASSRTMQVEVALANRDGALLPGAYVQVSLALEGGQGMVIPASALIFRGDGVRVASVEGNGRVKLRPVKLGRNLGQTIEVLEGIAAGERLVMNPSDSLADGDVVTLAR